MFITFEGIDGSGKSTALESLKKYIEKKYDLNNFIFTREPGGYNLSECEKIRDILLDNNNQIDPMTETLLYLASRTLHVSRLIKPAIENKKIVICDRFFDSSIAYQGGGRNLGPKLVEDLNMNALNNFKPNYTFYFKIDLKTSINRMRENNRNFDRLENEKTSFFEKVLNTYDNLSKQNTKRFIIIDASKSKEEVYKQVIEKFEQIINTKN